MAYLLDALVILMILFCVWNGGRRGLAHTLTVLAGGVLAALAALWLAAPLASGVYDTWLQPRLERLLLERAQTQEAPQVEISLTSLLGSGDGALARYLDEQDIPRTIIISLDDRSTEGLRAVLAPVLQDVVRPAAVSLLTTAISLLLFLLLMLTVFFVARLLDQVFNLPGLRQLNRVGGWLLGALQGALFGLFFAVAVRFCADWGLFGPVVSAETVDSTRLVARAADWLLR